MFRVVVLGSGGTVPSIERNVPGIAIKAEGNVLLFDCGENTQRQMMRFGISYGKVSHIFLTHMHADHVMGIVGLTQTLDMNGREKELHIHGPKGTKKIIGTLLSIYRPTKYEIKIEEIKDADSIDFGKYFVKSFKTKHGNSLGYIIEQKEKIKFDEKKAKSLGIHGPMFREIERKGSIDVGEKKIKLEEVSRTVAGIKIVYTGDTMPCESVLNASKNADLLIHDGTFGSDMVEEAKFRLHSTVADATRTAKICNVKTLVLVHISNRYKDAKDLENQAKSIFNNSVVAEDGTEFLL